MPPFPTLLQELMCTGSQIQKYFLMILIPMYGHREETYLALRTGGRSIVTMINTFALQYMHIKKYTFKISIHKTNLIFSLVSIIKSEK